MYRSVSELWVIELVAMYLLLSLMFQTCFSPTKVEITSCLLSLSYILVLAFYVKLIHQACSELEMSVVS